MIISNGDIFICCDVSASFIIGESISFESCCGTRDSGIGNCARCAINGGEISNGRGVIDGDITGVIDGASESREHISSVARDAYIGSVQSDFT